jgi:hypothetical protein
VTAIERELARVACGRSPHSDWGKATQYTLSACGRVQAFIVVGAGGVSVWKLIDYRVSHLAKSELITSVAHLREMLTTKGITDG